MSKGRALAVEVVAAILIATASIEVHAEPRGVIELFTSQDCSLCPAADRLLGELKKDRSLITLSLPIDYWDYLGWKDTLAHPHHTARQKAYSQMRGDREIYTPQAVIDGTAHALGSDKRAIERAVAESHRSSATLSVPVRVSVADGKLSVIAPAAETDGGSAEVWLYGVAKSVAVAVGRGENRGRTLTYTNVVRQWLKLGNWSGKSESWTVPVDAIKSADVDAVAVILQAGSTERPGLMLGAVATELR